MEKSPSLYNHLESETETTQLRLAELSIAEQQAIREWFDANESELSPQQRRIYLEEFLQHGLLNDDEALSHVNQLPHDERSVLGNFISSVIEPGRYAHCFYKCWPHLSEEVKEAAIDLCVNESPENFVQVAPFVSPRENRTTISEDGKEKKEHLLKTYYASPSEAVPLLKSLLDYNDHLHSELQLLEQRVGDDDELLTDEDQALLDEIYVLRESLKEYVKVYTSEISLSQEALLVLSDRLETAGLLTDQFIKDRIYTPEDPFVIYPKQIADELDKLKKTLRHVDGSEAVIYGSTFDPTDYVPRAAAFRYLQIYDQAEIDTNKIVFGSFAAYKDRLPNQREFIGRYLDGGWPVFAEVSQLGLDKKEVISILKQMRANDEAPTNVSTFTDIQALIQFDAEHPEPPDITAFLSEWIIEELREQTPYSYFSSRVVTNIRNLEEIFPEKYKEQFQAFLKEERPDLLINNLSYATDELGLSIRDVIEAPTLDLNKLFALYDQVLYHIKKSGLSDVEQSELLLSSQERILDLLRIEPQMLFIEPSAKQLESILPEALRKEILDAAITVPINPLFYRVIVESSQCDQYKEKLREVALNDINLLRDCSYYTVQNFYTPILSSEEFQALLLNNIQELPTDYLLQDSFFDWWPEDKLDELLQVLHDANDITGLCKVSSVLWKSKYPQAGYLYSSPVDKEKYVRSELSQLTRELQGRNPATDAKVIMNLQRQITDKQAELRSVKTEQLTEAVRRDSAFDERLLERSQQMISDLCGAHINYVFKEGVADALQDEAFPYIRRDISSYIKQDPSVLAEKYKAQVRPGAFESRHILENALGEQHTYSLGMTHMRKIVFGEQRYPGASPIFVHNFPSKLASSLTALNPFEATEDLKEKTDYYQDLMQVVSEYTFFPIFKARLESIYSTQLERFGPQKNPSPDRAFTEIIRKVGLLEHTPLAKRFVDEIAALPEGEQETVIDLFVETALVNLDQECTDLSASLDAVCEKLKALMREYSLEMLGVTHVNKGSFLDTASAKTINSLATYKHTLRRRNSTSSALGDIVNSLAVETFHDWRSKLTGSNDPYEFASLQERGVLPTQLSQEQFAAWNNDEELSLDELLTMELADYRQGIEDVLKLAEVDQHVPEGALSAERAKIEQDYESLIIPLQTITKQQRYYADRIKANKKAKKAGEPVTELTSDELAEYEQLKSDAAEYRALHGEAIDLAKARVCLHELQNISLQELERGSLEKKFNLSLQDVHALIQKTIIAEHPLFAEDYARIVGFLNEAKQVLFDGSAISRRQLALTDTVDFETIFNIGETPVPSCQSYKSTIDMNAGLLAYLSDPNVRIIQVRDEANSLIARCILRLLGDEDGQPALFAERVYSVNPHKKIKEAIAEFAARKAEMMGVPVYTQEHLHEHLQQGTASKRLVSRGSLAPFVYSDAGGGLKENGEFSIVSTIQITEKASRESLAA